MGLMELTSDHSQRHPFETTSLVACVTGRDAGFINEDTRRGCNPDTPFGLICTRDSELKVLGTRRPHSNAQDGRRGAKALKCTAVLDVLMARARPRNLTCAAGVVTARAAAMAGAPAVVVSRKMVSASGWPAQQ